MYLKLLEEYFNICLLINIWNWRLSDSLNKILRCGIFFFLMILLILPNNYMIYANSREEDSSKLINNVKISGFNSDLLPGDLVFCEVWDYLVKYFNAVDIPSGFDHVAIYIGKFYGFDWVVEATYLPIPKVIFTPLFLLKLYSEVTYCRVNLADESLRRDAIDFAVSQLGKPYQHLTIIPNDDPFRWHANYNPDDTTDPYSDWWYCAELVWASYYNQGINLDPIYPENRLNNFIEGYGFLRFVSPQNIFNSENTTSLDIFM